MPRLLHHSALLALSAVLALLVSTCPHPLFAGALRQTPAPGGDPVIAAAGDISKCNREEDGYTGYLLDSISGPILSMGDNAYEAGTLQEFTDCYGPTWGRHLDQIYPVPGNHEYLTGGASGYFTYFGDKATPLEPGCRKECGGYYSFNVGAWHIVALNSEIATQAGSPQEQWLRADLAANPTRCTLAFWHRPRFSSGHHGSGAAVGLWQALYDYGADIVLSGHDHDYERFSPQDPSAQYAPDRGIRQFVVGTGGDALRDYTFIQPNSEVRNAETWGILKLTLHPDSYDWEFVPIPGQTFTDSGSASCVTAPNVPSAPVVEATPAAAALASTETPNPAVAVQPDEPATVTAALLVAGVDYTIQAGDTLSAIAARYGLLWTALAQANQLKEDSLLQIGQVLRIPGAQPASSSALSSSATAATTATATLAAAATTTGTAAVGTTATVTDTAAGRYTVAAGDTLLGLAWRFGLTRSALAAANGLSESARLQVGQVLSVPAPAASAGVAPVAASAPLTGTAGSTAAGTGKFYTVESGDTIITIALAHNADWNEVLKLNGMTPTSILQIGQKIRLP